MEKKKKPPKKKATQKGKNEKATTGQVLLSAEGGQHISNGLEIG